MIKKIVFVIVAVLSLITLPISVCATSRTYTNADIQMLSTGYTIENINGTHQTRIGNGHDDNIVLFGTYFWFYHFTVQTNDQKFPQGSGWHTKVEITGFNGWMFGQNHSNIFGKYPTLLKGHCDLLKITVYRS
jgi:hypothetical protein